MRVFGIAVASTVAIAAAMLGAGPGAAAPPGPGVLTDSAGGPKLDGAVDNIGYRVGLTEDRRAAAATLSAGTFQLAHDGRVVTVNNAAGAVLAALPMAVRIDKRRVALAPKIDQSGTRLTLSPVGAATAPLRDVSSTQDKFFAEVNRLQEPVIGGAIIGGAIGFVLGFPLGLFVLDFITVPVATVAGAAIGAMAGYAMAGGQPAIDLALAYVNGAP